jgi:O-antigen ligase
MNHRIAISTETLREKNVLLRNFIFVFFLGLAWASARPFQDLASQQTLETLQSGDLRTQIAYSIAGICSVFIIIFGNVAGLRALMRPIYMITVTWLALTVLTSQDVDLSLKRFILSAITVTIAAILPLLPTSKRHLDILLCAIASAIVISSLIAVVVTPNLAIHQANDFFEMYQNSLDDLPGSWRGLYDHKNIAGGMMAIFVCIGLYSARALNPAIGYTLASMAGFFLYFSHAKTSLIILPISLIVSKLATRARSLFLKAVIILTPLVLLLLTTLGSIFADYFMDLARFSPDTSFSGRADIWRYAIEQILNSPYVGYGFSAFWRGDGVLFGDMSSVASFATNSHNSFLETALTSGLPGLVLVSIWLVYTPIVDYQKCRDSKTDVALTLLFVRIWIFCLYFAVLEGIFFDRTNPVWFSMILSTFSLRYLSYYPIVSASESGSDSLLVSSR